MMVRCPFCEEMLEVYIWSFAGSGKRCSCGALLGRFTFEFSENSINEMVVAAKKEYIDEMISELELEGFGLAIAEEIESIIVEVFSSGVKIGACNMLEAINSVAALSTEDSVLHVAFDETTESMS